MLAIFCARVALGLVACLLLLSPRRLHPRFFRTQFLAALGLLVIATFAAWREVGPWPRGLVAAATVFCLLGALSWTLDPAPGGCTLIVLTALALLASMTFLEPAVGQHQGAGEMSFPRWRSGSAGQIPSASEVVSNLLWAGAGASSAFFLGAALTAMLVGHSYLISPGMALAPLMRCLLAGGVALAVRVGVIGWGCGCWIGQAGPYNMDNEILLELPVRWLVGVLGPLVFGLMAYSAARIRSTQSATGILYVVVVCVFLGELLGLLLTHQTGLPL